MRKMRKKATKWVMRPSRTTGFLPKRLFLFSIPNTPPPGQTADIKHIHFLGGGWSLQGGIIIKGLCFNDSPRISPAPMQIPETPIRLLASVPNRFMAPIQVPYTPL